MTKKTPSILVLLLSILLSGCSKEIPELPNIKIREIAICRTAQAVAAVLVVKRMFPTTLALPQGMEGLSRFTLTVIQLATTEVNTRHRA